MCLHRRHRAHSISSKMPQTWSDEYFHCVFFGVLEDVGLLVGTVVDVVWWSSRGSWGEGGLLRGRSGDDPWGGRCVEVPRNHRW